MKELPSQRVAYIHFLCREYLLQTRFSSSKLKMLAKKTGAVRCPECAVTSEARFFIPIPVGSRRYLAA